MPQLTIWSRNLGVQLGPGKARIRISPTGPYEDDPKNEEANLLRETFFSVHLFTFCQARWKRYRCCAHSPEGFVKESFFMFHSVGHMHHRGCCMKLKNPLHWDAPVRRSSCTGMNGGRKRHLPPLLCGIRPIRTRHGWRYFRHRRR